MKSLVGTYPSLERRVLRAFEATCAGVLAERVDTRVDVLNPAPEDRAMVMRCMANLVNAVGRYTQRRGSMLGGGLFVRLLSGDPSGGAGTETVPSVEEVVRRAGLAHWRDAAEVAVPGRVLVAIGTWAATDLMVMDAVKGRMAADQSVLIGSIGDAELLPYMEGAAAIPVVVVWGTKASQWRTLGGGLASNTLRGWYGEVSWQPKDHFGSR